MLIEGAWYTPSSTQRLFPTSQTQWTPLKQLFVLFRAIIMPSNMLKETFLAMMLPPSMTVPRKGALMATGSPLPRYSYSVNVRLADPGPADDATTYDGNGVYILEYTPESKTQRRRELFKVLNEEG